LLAKTSGFAVQSTSCQLIVVYLYLDRTTYPTFSQLTDAGWDEPDEG
jgi:hypothetical protein